MISPAVVDNALRVYFPTSPEPADTSFSPCVSYQVGVNGVEAATVATGSARSVTDLRCGLISQDSIHDTTTSSFSLGLSEAGYYIGFANPSHVKARIGRSTQNWWINLVALDANTHYAVNNLSEGVDSPEVQAEQHLYKMKVFEASDSRRRALDYMYDFLEDAFEQRDTLMIDHMLFRASRELVGHSLSVSFLRATSRARKHLTFWKLFEMRVRQSLSDNPNARKLLKGLD